MPHYMVACYLPDNFDPSTVTAEDGAAIHALNDEMEAAGALKFACGVAPAGGARTLVKQADGNVLHKDGPFTEAKEHVGGLLLLEAADMDAAVAWAMRGAGVFAGPVEVREIFFQQDPKFAAE